MERLIEAVAVVVRVQMELTQHKLLEMVVQVSL
jgi:hypothetical protein